MEFGEGLRQHRERAGFSQHALARLVDLDPSYINRLESGDREPPKRAVVARLAEALGLADAERQRLLVAGGHLPDWLLLLEPDDPTLLQVARFLTAPDISAPAKEDFRVVVELIVARWGRGEERAHGAE